VFGKEGIAPMFLKTCSVKATFMPDSIGSDPKFRKKTGDRIQKKIIYILTTDF